MDDGLCIDRLHFILVLDCTVAEFAFIKCNTMCIFLHLLSCCSVTSGSACGAGYFTEMKQTKTLADLHIKLRSALLEAHRETRFECCITDLSHVRNKSKIVECHSGFGFGMMSWSHIFVSMYIVKELPL